ncbi:MAG: VWA domain-containing protein, partial [Gemmatimonadales bacterium]|nr:VWA domain-containing protein [Gemmatimonadales bacterium]
DPRRHRLDVLGTLRAAAPWQRVRGARPGRLAIRGDDFRVKRLKQKVGTTIVFAVDASGSAAVARLGEAKGAVELLLAESYARRDKVALVSFRGTTAETVLPPTRSLTRAKRALAGLPGGGGTPLAAAIDAVRDLAAHVRRGGGKPMAVFLTDGRANVPRAGSGGRQLAEQDAEAAARALGADGVRALVIDTASRPNPFAGRLAMLMDGQYLPLPAADARRIGGAVRTAAGGAR